jgi:RNA polymerase sigma-70 factor (ECF subfamily)
MAQVSMDSTSQFLELFEHSEWVRALALRLCDDPHAADDVAQEVWSRALRQPGRARSAREWLGGIVRHVAARRRASEASRFDRERRAARHEAVPSSDALLAEAELARKLLQVIASLQENHRQVVLLHYYEGLSTEQIARRLGAPSSTVRNRLSRARAQLREHLDGEYGGRSTWMAILAPSVAWEARLVTTGVGMGMKTAAAAVVVVLGVAAVLWIDEAQEDRSSPAQPATARVREPATGEAAQVPASDRTATSEGGSEPRAAEGSKPRFEQLLVHGELLGLPPAESREGSLSFLGADDVARAASLGANGAYSIFGLTPGTWRVWGSFADFRPLDVSVELDGSEKEVRRDFTLSPATVLAVKFVDASTGEPLEFPPLDPIGDGLGIVVTKAPISRATGVLERTPRASAAADYRPRGAATAGLDLPADSAGRLTLLDSPPLFAHAVLREHVLESRALGGSETELVFALDRARLEASLSTLTLRCVAAVGAEPIPRASVELGFDDGSGERAETDANGVVRLERLAPGLRTLSVWVPQTSNHHRWLRLAPGETLDLGTLALSPPVRIRGRVLDPDGAGISTRLAYTVVGRDALPGDSLTELSTGSTSDGAFDLACMEPGRLRIVAEAEGFSPGWIEVDATAHEVGGLELRLQRGFDVRVELPRGAFHGVQVRLVDERGVCLRVARARPPAPLRWTLAPDAYDLQLVVDDTVAAPQPFVVVDRGLSLELTAP